MSIWKQLSDETWCCHVADESQTDLAARQIARLLQAGDVLALIGDLGAGKTRFVKSIAQALGVPIEEVNSPTFTLIQEYDGRIRIRHCDTYRLRSVDEFVDLGLDELFAADGIAIVEWADRVKDDLPRDHLEVVIAIESPTTRTINAKPKGRRSREILSQLASSEKTAD